MGREESIWVHKPQDAGTRQNNKCELMEEKGVLGGPLCSGEGWAQEDRTHYHACGSAGQAAYLQTLWRCFPGCVIQVYVLHRCGQECTMAFGKPWVSCVRREVAPGDVALRCWRVRCWQEIFPGWRIPGLSTAAKAAGGGRMMPGLRRLKKVRTR